MGALSKLTLKKANLAVVSSLLLALPMASFAAPIQFDDRAVFEAAAGLVTTETFDSFLVDVNLAPSITFDVGDFSITGPTDGTALVETDGSNSFSINGTTFIEGIGRSNTFMDFTFDLAIYSFGVDLFGVNNGAERTQVIINASTYSLPVISSSVGSFFGLVSDVAFTNVRFKVLSGGETAGLDNISYSSSAPGSSVPEPGILALFGLGLAGLGLKRRRKI